MGTQKQRLHSQHIIAKSLLIAIAHLLALTLAASAQPSIELHHLASFSHGGYLKQASEVVAHDPATQRLFVVNSQMIQLDVLDIRDPKSPRLAFKIDAASFGSGLNSVDVFDGVVAAAIEDTNAQAPGSVVFFDTEGRYLNKVRVGAMPDMLKFSPDGRWLLTADEGEPNKDYTIDPEGSVSIIDLSPGVRNVRQKHVRAAGFAAFNDKKLDPRIRVFGPNATPAQDFEPEYLAISPDSRTAWVVLQENNALATIDILQAEVTQVTALGFKDFNQPGNEFDASNHDNAPDIKNWPVKGMYQPDAIVAFQANGQIYLVTANEGDPRSYAGFSEAVRVEDLELDETAFQDIEKLQKKKNLGRLKVTKLLGDTDGDGDFEELYTFGARSFAIWRDTGELVFESGSDFEQITAAAYPKDFNSDNKENGTMDNRSDDRGPEPEGLALAEIDKRRYAFIGLERIGGVMVYDITEPEGALFVQYVNHRKFKGNASEGTAGDLGPEGLCFIDAKNSPNGKPLLIVANEVSGTTSLFEVRPLAAGINSSFAWQKMPPKLTMQPADSTLLPRKIAVIFSLPEAANVQIDVVDDRGKVMATAFEKRLSSGEHAIDFQPRNLLPGTYYCRFLVDGVVQQIRKVRLQ